ncbi:MAG: ABC transporter ATP-binding protein/permease, partial [Saccharofermentans sp.]|nr:ABC transporter ATP-binding protein/permease [Saccharofermentans sp.]
KQYKTGSLIQKALDDVSLNLRDNEFVAILGPSGSGKTTLLNIIGGLDRYDSGDLIINGTSTKKYKDRDWDSYRNHTIGFVFQSYNLIPHQTLLANVELALTISGISGKERKMRALDALEKVGLRDQAHKKPNQLSGGQMQRVAIARALVNNPDILLADEPTGALDSETSVHVMDLLKEVAKDRLVVMVTHNPELAEQYATRIVRLKDGKIISDSDPLPDKSEAGMPIHRNLGKASMSFFTALALSFNNLWTKKARTVLVAFAGSIGIIGIALILSLSTGVNKYIEDTEAETLSQYPISIEGSSVSVMSMMMAPNETSEPARDGYIIEVPSVGRIVSSVRTNDLDSLRVYLESGGVYAGEDQADAGMEVHELTNGIEYTYDLTPYIFKYDPDDNRYRQVNPNDDFSSLGIPSASVFSSMYSMNVFYELPSNESLYIDQYDVRAGRWPENSSEAVLVLSTNGAVSDYIIYTFGLRDADELESMIQDFANGVERTYDDSQYEWSYDDFMGAQFKVCPAFNFYKYDDTLGVYTNMKDNRAYMNGVLENARDLTIVGIVSPKEGEDITMLSSGIYYGEDLIEEIREEADDAEIVLAQLADREVNVLTGERFDEEDTGFDMSELFSIDEELMGEAFVFDEEAFEFDGDAFGDLEGLDLESEFAGAMPNMSATDIGALLNGVNLKVDGEKLQGLMQQLLTGYMVYAAQDPSTNYANFSGAFQQYLQSDDGRTVIREQLMKILTSGSIGSVSNETMQSAMQAVMTGYSTYAIMHGINPADMTNFNENLNAYLNTSEGQQVVSEQMDKILAEMLTNTNITDAQLSELATALIEGYIPYAAANQLPDPSRLGASFSEYLATEEASAMITAGALSAINMDQIEAQVASNMNVMMAGMSTEMASAMEKVFAKIGDKLAENIQNAFEDKFSDMGSLLTIDEDLMAEAFQINVDEDELASYMTELMSGGGASSAESNLTAFGYCAEDHLSSITIYPKDFEAKDAIVSILDDYNDKVADVDDGKKVISYTDIVGALMKSVTKIVNTISYVLIAFVSISLVVSSIMIGVITYISVLERRKEIGILRAMGASKHNVAQVFNAETIITGFLAGLFGVGISLILLIPGNMLIHYLGDTEEVSAYLPPVAAGILVLLSVILTLIGGLIPSRKASKQDPVTALRTD